MPEPRIPLQPSKFYHIYNHAVGDDKFFRKNADYDFFIFKTTEYILPVTDVFAYCLMPNHFHFVVQIKPAEQIKAYLEFKLGNARFNSVISREGFLEHQLSRIYANLFNTYAKHYNLAYHRMGTLFKRAFMCKSIEDNDYLFKAISYVHLNPVSHKQVTDPESWKYCSYSGIVSNSPSIVNQQSLLALFNGMDNFIHYHQVAEVS